MKNPTIIVNRLFLMADSEQNLLRLFFLQLIKKKNHLLVKDTYAYTDTWNGATALSLDSTGQTKQSLTNSALGYAVV